MSTKKALKSVRDKLQDGSHEAALYEVTQLLKALDLKDPDTPSV